MEFRFDKLRFACRCAFAALSLILIAGCTAAPSTLPAATLFAKATATLERVPTRRASLLNGTPAPPVAVPGKFTFAPGDGSIWLQDPANGAPKPIISPTAELFADAPQFSPDGEHVVYISSTLSAQGVAQNSVHIIDVDGKNDRAVAVPPNAKTSFNWPTYSWDGKWIYYTASFPVPPNKVHSEIDRIPVTGGNAAKVIDDARSGGVSPDDKTIAFIRFNFDTFSGALWTADINGQNAKQLLSDDAFLMISSPQYSPDGKSILFSASGPPTKPLPGATNWQEEQCEPLLLCLISKPAFADGLPWDLWLVSADGLRFEQLTNVASDSPWPAWSGDGKQVAFFDTSGIYLVELATKGISQISRNGGHGIFDWWTQP